MSTTINRAAKSQLKSYRRQCGFTLLELILSMTLTALLLTTLSAGMYVVINDWQRDTSGLDTLLDESLALLQIEKALIAAFPHSYHDVDRVDRFIYFKGLDDELSWVSTVSPQRQPGLTAWHLKSEPTTGLQLSLTPAFSDNPEARLADASPSTILENYHAQFRYLWQRTTEEKEWLDQWLGEDMQSLPLAVHIIFTPIDDSRAASFELLAPIKNYRHEDIQATTPDV